MKLFKNIVFIYCLLLLSCSKPRIDDYEEAGTYPEIYPDYKEVTIPPNIAPLNFRLLNFENQGVLYIEGDAQQIRIKSSTGKFLINPSQWEKLLKQNIGKTIRLTVYEKGETHWIKYKPFSIKIEKELIDPFLVYRLIEPGYELWETMGIYQRNMENMDEFVIYENRMTNYNCVNCHSFCMQSPDKMLFHMRGDYSSTILLDKGNIEKIDTKTDSTISSFVYPAWNPSGNFIAFSVNDIAQSFYLNNENRLEVFDSKSDIVIYNAATKKVFTNSLISSPDCLETFPGFSPDGKTLYFCSAKQLPVPQKSDMLKYNICSISFNESDGTFGKKVDTLYNARIQKKSASFPRISPNGKYLLFTVSNYGTFPIWHKESDLMLYSLKDDKFIDTDLLNSNNAESYHSWASNSRWIIYSSRRDDGLYTRPYISYVGDDGDVGKSFMLPQKDPDYYKFLMKSYNIPEFVTGKVNANMYNISRYVKNQESQHVTFVQGGGMSR